MPSGAVPGLLCEQGEAAADDDGKQRHRPKAHELAFADPIHARNNAESALTDGYRRLSGRETVGHPPPSPLNPPIPALNHGQRTPMMGAHTSAAWPLGAGKFPGSRSRAESTTSLPKEDL